MSEFSLLLYPSDVSDFLYLNLHEILSGFSLPLACHNVGAEHNFYSIHKFMNTDMKI